MGRIYRAAKYIRTSCPDDSYNHGDSVANQSKLIDKFLQSQPEIAVVSERIDNGFSGVFFDRPAFNEMIADIEAGDIDCIVVKDLTRLGRNYIETGRFLRDILHAKGVRFISVDDNIDSIMLDEFENTIIMIKSIFSEQYSRDVSRKTRCSLDIKRKQGKYVGAIPVFGYRKSEDSKHKLSIDPNAYSVVQSIFTMKLQGMSAAGIAAELNSSCILSPIAYKRKHDILHPTGGFADNSDPRWSATTILRILRDENYTGTLVQGRQRRKSYKTRDLLRLQECEWVKTENVHTAIITRHDYETVQRLLTLDTRKAPDHNKVYVFSGLLVCGHCGGSITRKTVRHSGRQYIYYYCTTTKSNGCRSLSMISEQDLYGLVTKQVKERIGHIHVLSKQLSANNINELVNHDYVRKIAIRNQSIQELQRFRIHLHVSMAYGIIDEEELLGLQDYYDGEIARLCAEVGVLRNKSKNIEQGLADELEWTGNFLKFIDMEELDRYAVAQMINCIRVVGKREIAVEFVNQHEYEQAIRYLSSGGHQSGKKEPKTQQPVRPFAD